MKCKQFIAGFLTCLILLSAIFITGFADTQTIEAFFNNIKLTIDGKEVELKDALGNPVKPFIVSGTTYLPVRAIAGALGMEVSFNESTNTVMLNSVEKVISSPVVQQNVLEEGNSNSMKRSDLEYDLVTGLPIGAEYVENDIEIETGSDYKKTISYKTISFNGKTYISEFDLRNIYNIVFIGKGSFVNKNTNNTVTIDFQTNTFTVKATLYIDMSLFDGLIGE